MITVKVKVTPAARREHVEEMGKHVLSIFVREPAQRGLATARVKVLVARHYGIAISEVRLATGGQSRSKTFYVQV